MLRSRERDGLVEQLTDARKRIVALEADLERLNSRDPLAGNLLSLRAFRERLEFEVNRARAAGQPLSVALLDLDGFRSLNAHQGHAAGDAVLAAVAASITSATRDRDLACRTGGDEFAVMLAGAPAAQAAEAMGRVLRALEDLDVGGVQGLSASAGVAHLQGEQAPDRLLGAAATALDHAREAGGGRVAVASGQKGPAEPGRGDVLTALASALEERDRYTGEHSESVVDLTTRVAVGLGLSPDDVQRIRTAALLHDIGKIGVPDEILHKPGPLDDREWEIMRQHPEIGERILRAIPGMGPVARIVRHEHERWDGGGYPDGLGGEDIPVGARIILACDAYHAMVSDRPYRHAMAHVDAMAELTRNAETQFDPRVVEVLVGYLYGRRQAGQATV